MPASLIVRGGRDALEHLREQGFQQQDVKAMLGASGGPKWFILAGLDKALLGTTFKGRTDPLHLLGTSAGCWRFASYCMSDPVAAIGRFEQSYISHSYSERPNPAEITAECRRTLRDVLSSDGPAQILANPVFRLNLIAVRARGAVASSIPFLQAGGLLVSAVANAISRKQLGRFYTRIVFEHPDGGLPVRQFSDLPTQHVQLTLENLACAVEASGSIPYVLEGVRDIAGAGPGLYLDGGVTDYHFDLPVFPKQGLVLYPHFRETPIPGWFDKHLSSRKPSAEHYRRTLIVTPSPEFVNRLPYGKIPDRKDFQTMDTPTRQKYWCKVVAESDRLGDEWLELVEKNQLAEVAQPLTFADGAG